MAGVTDDDKWLFELIHDHFWLFDVIPLKEKKTNRTFMSLGFLFSLLAGEVAVCFALTSIPLIVTFEWLLSLL